MKVRRWWALQRVPRCGCRRHRLQFGLPLLHGGHRHDIGGCS